GEATEKLGWIATRFSPWSSERALPRPPPMNGMERGLAFDNISLSDCTSCHTSSPVTHRLQIADDPTLRFQLPKALTGFASVAPRQDGPDDYVVRAFGYMPSIAIADGGDGKNHPIVSNRAATESALVVDIINRQILKLPSNAGRDCSASAVWSCFAVV